MGSWGETGSIIKDEGPGLWAARTGLLVQAHSSKFRLSTHGIIHEKTAPYSPEMNGKIERKNRRLIELVVVILSSSGVASHW